MSKFDCLFTFLFFAVSKEKEQIAVDFLLLKSCNLFYNLEGKFSLTPKISLELIYKSRNSMYNLKVAIFDENMAIGKSKYLVILYLYKHTQLSDPLILGGLLILLEGAPKLISREQFKNTNNQNIQNSTQISSFNNLSK